MTEQDIRRHARELAQVLGHGYPPGVWFQDKGFGRREERSIRHQAEQLRAGRLR